MKDFFYSLMTDKRNDPVFIPVKFVLYVLSLAYGTAIFARTLLYKFNLFKSTKVQLKVISVGNLTLGGTGKTPFVIMLARILNDTIHRETAVLIRGYGWDEQAMLKKNLPDIPILVGEDRVKSSRRAVKLYGSSVAVMDDGFQHWELKRDLDIVLVDSRKPFGNGELFPRGILREPKGALKRAGVAVLTKVDKGAANVEGLRRELASINNGLLIVEAVHKAKYFYDPKARKDQLLSFVAGKRVILLSSIGDPGYFADTIKEMKAEVVEHIIYSDHHNYSQRDMDNILKRCSERAFDFVITTDKDAVKLNRMSLSFGKYAWFVLKIEMELVSGKEELVARLNSLLNR